MSDDKRPDDDRGSDDIRSRGERAARDAATAMGSAGRRLARGLREMTRRPGADDDPGEERSNDDLGRQVRDFGRSFAGLMESVSVTTGKKIRKTAYDVSDTVRGVVESARKRPPDE